MELNVQEQLGIVEDTLQEIKNARKSEVKNICTALSVNVANVKNVLNGDTEI
jgi:hypothetical protein